MTEDTTQPAAPATNDAGEFIPPPIQGYRALSPETVALINEVKAHAEQTRTLLSRVEHFCLDRNEVEKQTTLDYVPHTAVTEPMRWTSIARTDLQQGYMALIRAIAAPTTF